MLLSLLYILFSLLKEIEKNKNTLSGMFQYICCLALESMGLVHHNLFTSTI